jgi:hypothetical protein
LIKTCVPSFSYTKQKTGAPVFGLSAVHQAAARFIRRHAAASGFIWRHKAHAAASGASGAPHESFHKSQSGSHGGSDVHVPPAFLPVKAFGAVPQRSGRDSRAGIANEIAEVAVAGNQVHAVRAGVGGVL